MQNILDFLYSIDTSVFLFINVTLSHPLLDPAMTRITELKFWLIPGLLAAALYVFRENKKKALTVLGLVALTVALSDPISSQILKKIFHRPRPCNPDFYVAGGRFLKGMLTSLSFPSSHSVNMFAFATILFCFYRRYGVYFYSFAGLIAYTRVYNGVHYPSDVAGGAVVGCLLGWGVYTGFIFIQSQYFKPKTENKDQNQILF
ncbi:MAG: phosphatase PAP2 family protein [Chitinispirillales bacterium]|jgi:undecaprenyl-diphosphatase|nr:phosphatase PAP2 family protein [Chitinispirillales bacterium]